MRWLCRERITPTRKARVGRLAEHCPLLTGQGASGEQLIGQSLRRFDVEFESKAGPIEQPAPSSAEMFRTSGLEVRSILVLP
jgi:hypothetical protein